MRNFKYQLSLLFAVSALFFSCGRTSPSVPVVEFDMKSFDTCSVRVADTVFTPVTKDAFSGIFDSKFGYVIGQEKGGDILHIVNPITGELQYSFGKTGRGPNEFISPVLVDMDYERDFLYVSDPPKGELSRIVLRENSAYIDTSFRIQGLYTGWVGVDDSLCIALLNSDNKAMLLLINENREANGQQFLHSLLDDKRIKDPTFVTNLSRLGISRQKHLIVCTGINLPAVACYSYTADKVELQWRLFLEKDIYRIEDGVPLANDHIEYEIDQVCFTDNNIYLILKQKMADGFNYLLRLDYSGQPVQLYKIACNFNYYFIMQDDSTLVGVVSKSEEDPDGYLVKVAL